MANTMQTVKVLSSEKHVERRIVNHSYADACTFESARSDSSTGLIYVNASRYDSDTGSWGSRAPGGFAVGDANLYRAIGNAMTNGVDPSGEIGVSIPLPPPPPFGRGPFPNPAWPQPGLQPPTGTKKGDPMPRSNPPAQVVLVGGHFEVYWKGEYQGYIIGYQPPPLRAVNRPPQLLPKTWDPVMVPNGKHHTGKWNWDPNTGTWVPVLAPGNPSKS